MFQTLSLLSIFMLAREISGPIGLEPLAVIRSEGGWLRPIAFSPDGKVLSFVTSTDIRLWDVSARKVSATLQDNGATSIAFAPDGKTLAAGNADHAIRLWDVAEGKLRTTLKGHTGAVTCLDFASQGRQLVSGSRDRSVMLWDMKTGKKEEIGKSGQEIDGIAVSPDGTTLAWPYMGQTVLSLVLGSQVRLIDVTTKRSLGSIRELFGADHLAFSPDGKVLATSSVGRKVKLWNVSDRKLQVQFTPNDTPRDERNVKAVKYSPTGATLVTVDYRGALTFWDPKDGKHQARLIAHTGEGEYFYHLAFSPDGKIMATAGGPEKTIKLWDVAEALKAKR
jgi:WD40 repeat protein